MSMKGDFHYLKASAKMKMKRVAVHKFTAINKLELGRMCEQAKESAIN